MKKRLKVLGTVTTLAAVGIGAVKVFKRYKGDTTKPLELTVEKPEKASDNVAVTIDPLQ